MVGLVPETDSSDVPRIKVTKNERLTPVLSARKPLSLASGTKRVGPLTTFSVNKGFEEAAIAHET